MKVPIVGALDALVNNDLGWSEGHSQPSDTLSLRQGAEQAGACRVRPLHPFRSFDRETEIEAKPQGSVEARSARRVTRILEPRQKPVTAHGIARLREERHHYLCRS